MKRLVLLVGLLSTAVTASSNSDDCSGGHVKLDDTCYILYKEHSQWEKAKERCSDNAMKLARIDSLRKSETVREFLATKVDRHTYTWLDMIFDDNQDTYIHTSNQKPVNTTFWADGEPSNVAEKCVAQHASGWVDVFCDRAFPFLCEKQGCSFCKDESVYTPTVTFCNNEKLHFGGDTCFYISKEHDSLTHNDANASCQTRGGQIARLDSHEKYHDLYAYVAGLPYGKWKSFWTAATRNSQGEFQYADGSPTTMAIWSENEPNNHNNKEHCAQSWYSYPKETYTWNDVNCESHVQYICEFAGCDLDVCLSTTTAATTTTPSQPTSTPAATIAPTASQTDESSSQITNQLTNDRATTEAKQNDDANSLLDLFRSNGHVVSATATTIILACLALLM